MTNLEKRNQMLEATVETLKTENDRKANDGRLFKSCDEHRLFRPADRCGTYRIDPDGVGVGEEPITVLCNMTTGTTQIGHDQQGSKQLAIDCVGRDCFTLPLVYQAPMRQMISLVQLSNDCHQTLNLSASFNGYICYSIFAVVNIFVVSVVSAKLLQRNGPVLFVEGSSQRFVSCKDMRSTTSR